MRKRLFALLAVVGLLALIAAGNAREKIVTYVENDPNITLSDLQGMSVEALQSEIRLTRLELRGKGKLKNHAIRWFQARARARKVAQLQVLIRTLPQMGSAVLIDVDPEQNIVTLYIDGLP